MRLICLMQLDRRVEGRIVSLVLCLQGLVAFLHWLDVSDIVYYATIHRRTVTGTFDLGWSPLPCLLLALGSWCVYSFFRGWWKETLFCLMPFLFGGFLGEAAVSVSLVGFSLMIIHREGVRGEALKWLFTILTILYFVTGLLPVFDHGGVHFFLII